MASMSEGEQEASGNRSGVALQHLHPRRLCRLFPSLLLLQRVQLTYRQW